MPYSSERGPDGGDWFDKYSEYRELAEKLTAENERLRAALMKIRTMQGDPIQIAREAMSDNQQSENKP